MGGVLISSDWHLTDSPKDEYRWRIFDTIRLEAKKRHKVTAITILGDISDKKDRHSSILVNRMVQEFVSLQTSTEADIYILKGNHDIPDGGVPYWEFMGNIPGIRVITEPSMVSIEERAFVMLPHSKDPELDWKSLDFNRISGATILAHQTISGALLSNGQKVINDFQFPDSAQIISGDVHVPQTIRNVTYVGAPHPVRFGDDYSPRILFWNKGSLESIPVRTIAKKMVRTDFVDGLFPELRKGDQIKIEATITEKDSQDLQDLEKRIRDHCAASGAELESLRFNISVKGDSGTSSESIEGGDDLDTLVAFSAHSGISDELLQIGAEIVIGESA